jgi:hypothetical protein
MGKRKYTPDATPWQVHKHGKGIYSVSRYTMGQDGGLDLEDHGYLGRLYTLEQATLVLEWENMQTA